VEDVGFLLEVRLLLDSLQVYIYSICYIGFQINDLTLFMNQIQIRILYHRSTYKLLSVSVTELRQTGCLYYFSIDSSLSAQNIEMIQVKCFGKES
jgi:hypothetical protein